MYVLEKTWIHAHVRITIIRLYCTSTLTYGLPPRELKEANRRRLRLTNIPVQLVQRWLRWFCHATRLPKGGLIKDRLILPRSWGRRTGGQLKVWATTLKEGLEPLNRLRVFWYARWWMVKVFSNIAQDRRVYGASIRDVINSIGNAGSTCPGWMLPQV